MTEERKTGIKILAAIGIGAAVILINFCYYKSHIINLNDYMKIEYEGYSGNATAKLTMDYQALQEDYGDVLKLPDDLKGKKSRIDGISPAVYFFGRKYLLDGDAGSIDPTRDISNGDNIHFQGYDNDFLDDDFGCYVKSESYTAEASGITTLTEANPDPFAGLKVVYDGGNSQAIAEVDTSEMEWPFNEAIYNLSKDSYLSNGDTIQVTLSGVSLSAFREFYDYVPRKTSETVTVSGLPALTEDNQASLERDIAEQEEEEAEQKRLQEEADEEYSSDDAGSSYHSSVHSSDDDEYEDDREEWGDEYDEEDYDSEYFDYDDYDENYYDEDL